MVMEIPGTRSAVLAIETYEGLDEFRRFRHVVRSNYAHQLAPDKVQALAGKLRVVSQNLLQDCQQFLTQVKPDSYLRTHVGSCCKAALSQYT